MLALIANLVSAVVRLGPIGQTDGQKILATLLPRIRALAREAATLDPRRSRRLRLPLRHRHDAPRDAIFAALPVMSVSLALTPPSAPIKIPCAQRIRRGTRPFGGNPCRNGIGFQVLAAKFPKRRRREFFCPEQGTRREFFAPSRDSWRGRKARPPRVLRPRSAFLKKGLSGRRRWLDNVGSFTVTATGRSLTAVHELALVHPRRLCENAELALALIRKRISSV